jgi:hypothetical protein
MTADGRPAGKGVRQLVAGSGGVGLVVDLTGDQADFRNM